MDLLDPTLEQELQSPRRPDRHRPRRPGEQSAGQLLAVILAALVLAALVNADALVERAERKPLGAGRDRSLMLWHPVQDIAHLTQLSRLRDLGDALAGNEDAGGEVATPVRRTPAADPATVPRPTLRSPTTAAPLRVFIGGDSVVRDAGESLLQLSADDPLLQSTLHYEIASGLTRPDFYDWPSALRADMVSGDPDIAIVMFGANDAQGIVGPDGTVYQRVSDPGWQAEYARRVGLVMDDLRGGRRLVLWVGQPPMREAGFNGRIEVLDRIYREQAEQRPWVTYVDTVPILGDARGAYAERLPGADGGEADVRQDDGIHLSRGGADRLASHLLDLIAAEIAAAAPSTTVAGDASG